MPLLNKTRFLLVLTTSKAATIKIRITATTATTIKRDQITTIINGSQRNSTTATTTSELQSRTLVVVKFATLTVTVRASVHNSSPCNHPINHVKRHSIHGSLMLMLPLEYLLVLMIGYLTPVQRTISHRISTTFPSITPTMVVTMSC